MNSAPLPFSKAQPGISLIRACYSDPGRQRERNEDACALPFPGVDEAGLGTLIALADGAGGLPGGAEASREAVRYLQAVYYAETGLTQIADRLRFAFEAVNALNLLVWRQPGSERGHLTTLVAAVVQIDQVWIANVGDSRAYLVQAASRQIQQLTEDHSRHVRNVKAGLVSDLDILSRQSGMITRAIGLQERCQVDTYHYTWSIGDRLLLCSDGLAGLKAEEMIPLALDSRPEVAARELVLRAVQVDGSDNCTAVVAVWLPEPVSQGDQSATIPSRLKSDSGTSRSALGADQRLSPLPDPPGSESEPIHREPRSRLSLWLRSTAGLLLLGLLLGWLSAALLIFLLQISGVIHLY